MFFRKIWDAIADKASKETVENLWRYYSQSNVKRISDHHDNFKLISDLMIRVKKLEDLLESKFKVKLHECNCERCK